jgi:hypothetical protein
MGSVSESTARLLSRLLLAGWLWLIATLWWSAAPGHLGGTVLFWAIGLPLVVVLLALDGTARWRRICPLSYVSLLPRALGRQRRRPAGASGPAQAPLVAPLSWLGRHHLRLQWCLLIGGLSLRLLLVNNDPHALALLFGLTLLSALLVGWAWDGKTWCHVFCPMGPVEAVLMGLRPVARSPGLLPESLCRTLTPEGQERSTCVHCHTPCLDIDSGRAYRHSLRQERGLGLAWWSYPGLVLAFFLLLAPAGASGLQGLRQASWARPSLALTASPLTPLPWLPLLPRLLALPLLLLLGSAVSILVFALLRRLGLSLHRTRLLATTSAIWIFFWFSDPTLGLWNAWPFHALQLLVAVVSLRWLLWGWRREV